MPRDWATCRVIWETKAREERKWGLEAVDRLDWGGGWIWDSDNGFEFGEEISPENGNRGFWEKGVS